MEFSGQQNSRAIVGGGYQASPSVYAVSEALQPAESPSRIRNSVGNVEQMLSGINDAIHALEKRLDTVLSPVPPQVANAAGKNLPTPVVSHLAGRVDILCDGFSGAIARLRELTDRVEV